MRKVVIFFLTMSTLQLGAEGLEKATEMLCELSFLFQSSPDTPGSSASLNVQTIDPGIGFTPSTGHDAVRPNARGIFHFNIGHERTIKSQYFLRWDSAQVVSLIPSTSPGTPVLIEMTPLFAHATDTSNVPSVLEEIEITLAHARDDGESDAFTGFRRINTANIAAHFFGVASTTVKPYFGAKPNLWLETFDGKKRFEMHLTCDFP